MVNKMYGQDSSIKRGEGRLSQVGDEGSLNSFPRTLPGGGRCPGQLPVTVCVLC